MKSIKNCISIILVAFIVLVSGCSSHHENERSIADQQLDKLRFTWKSSGVTLDGVAKDTYSNFKLAASGIQGNKIFGFTAEGRPSLSPWPAMGTFAFDEIDPLTKLLRDDNISITYEVTETTLTLRFNYAMAGFQGRIDAVKGQWEFRFAKQ